MEVVIHCKGIVSLQLLVETLEETLIHPLSRKHVNIKYSLHDVHVKM